MSDHSKAKSHSGVSTTKVASETSNANGLCKTIRNTCNVCGKPCTKRCSLCRLVFYCSTECQRKDWKRGHNKNCEGKQKKKVPPVPREAEKTVATKTEKKHIASKKIDGALTLECLPDEVLVHIGKTVLKLCSVRDYLSLARTSKQLRGLLTADDTVSTVIKAEGERVLCNSCNSWEFRHTKDLIVFGFPKNFKELQFWKIASELIQCNKIYLDVEDRMVLGLESAHNQRILNSIGKMLSKDPSVVVIVDSHLGLSTPREDRAKNSFTAGMKMCFVLVDLFVKENPGTNLECLCSRLFVRPWDADSAASAEAIEEAHRKLFGKGNWADVFVCMNGTEFPPRSSLYKDLEFPNMHPFSEIFNPVHRVIQNMTN